MRTVRSDGKFGNIEAWEWDMMLTEFGLEFLIYEKIVGVQVCRGRRRD